MQPNCSFSKEFSEVVDSNIYIRESRGLTTTKVLSMRLLKVSEVRNNHKQVTISLALSPYQTHPPQFISDCALSPFLFLLPPSCSWFSAGRLLAVTPSTTTSCVASLPPPSAAQLSVFPSTDVLAAKLFLVISNGAMNLGNNELYYCGL